MSADIADSLRIIAQRGGAAFAATGLAADAGPTVRRVRRRRVARVVGVSAAACLAVGAIGLTAFAAATRGDVSPGVNPSPSAIPSYTPPTPSFNDHRDEVLPGCSGEIPPDAQLIEGEMPDDALCVLWDGYTRLQAPAAVSLARLNELYGEETGKDLCIESGYLSLEDGLLLRQVRGESWDHEGATLHGWGLAIDLCTDDREMLVWFRQHASVYGWLDPLNNNLLHDHFEYYETYGPAVAIPQGWTVDRTLDRLAEVTGIPVSEFEAAAANPEAIGLPPEAGGSLDGWIWAATYQFPEDATATDILSEMIATTVFTLDYRLVTPENRLAVLTAASLVELEAKLDADRPKVARVIQNRLDAGMFLELDSTVHYLLGTTGSVLTSNDQRAADSPYNTYLHGGLPPGPICSPSEASIDAVLNPADGDWLYFVTVNLVTGETAFAQTFAEHVENVNQLNAWMAANGE